MTKEEIKKRVKETETAYKAFLKRLSHFKKEQDKIIADFEKILTNKRMLAIKKSLGITI